MTDEGFRYAAIAIFIVGALISIRFRRRAERRGQDKVSLAEEGLPMVLTLRLVGIALWLGVFAYMIEPRWMAWSRVALPEALRWTGVVLGILGDLLAWWVFSHLGHNVTPTVVTRPDAQLVTSGPYRWVRHPLYLMGLIGYIGFALLAENAFIAVMTLLVFLLLVKRTRKEEAQLLLRFGDAYRDYMGRTGGFFPRLG